MAAAAYMKLKGFTGAATDDQHKGSDGWVEIESFSSPIFRSIPDGATGQDRLGPTTLGDISVQRKVDASSPGLASKSAGGGEVIPEVVIELCTDVNKKQEVYLRITLTDVVLSGYSLAGSKDGRAYCAEDIQLNPASIAWFMQEFNDDGSKGGKGDAKYDPKANKA